MLFHIRYEGGGKTSWIAGLLPVDVFFDPAEEIWGMKDESARFKLGVGVRIPQSSESGVMFVGNDSDPKHRQNAEKAIGDFKKRSLRS